MLTLKSFKKSFGEVTILDIPNHSFNSGIHWVKGRNGSGKTTLFNCLAGLSPYEGQIKLSDIDLMQNPGSYKLKVNYSQSEPAFPEFLTGNDLLSYFAQLKQADSTQTAELCKALGVDQFADKPCGSYSSGMIKKLSVVLAFLGEPAVIILDEPLITLDKEAQDVVTRLIGKAYAQGTTFIFATHQDFENELIKATHVYEVKDQGLTTIS